jgi:hypothetical protein
MTIKRIHDREAKRATRVDYVAELIPATWERVAKIRNRRTEL